jgi:hypothetical protein
MPLPVGLETFRQEQWAGQYAPKGDYLPLTIIFASFLSIGNLLQGLAKKGNYLKKITLLFPFSEIHCIPNPID